MSEPIRVMEYLGGPLDGQEAFWKDPLSLIEQIQYALPTGATRFARYRLVKGSIQGEPFLAYVDNDIGKAEAVSLIANKLIQIESIG